MNFRSNLYNLGASVLHAAADLAIAGAGKLESVTAAHKAYTTAKKAKRPASLERGLMSGEDKIDSSSKAVAKITSTRECDSESNNETYVSAIDQLVESVPVSIESPGTSREINKAPETNISDDNRPIPRLFALLIGINTYNGEASSTASQPRASSAVNFPPFPNLRSALSDAEKFNNYLIADLKVHKDHITFLRDTEATRDRIIGAFKNLADDERIVKGDAIFVFYAGHGAQALPPKSMINKEGCPEKVELLLPHDYNHFPGNQENMGIPDYTLGALINKISKKKGDNITIVFDCCHSASALRGSLDARSDVIIRSAPPLTYHVPDELDSDIWQIEPQSSMRGCKPLDVHKYYGATSYVYFSACASSEFAAEDVNKGGRFTSALLELLKSHDPNTLTCSEVIARLPKINGQSPQCEGVQQNRHMFQSYVPSNSKKFFDVSEGPSDDNSYDFTMREGQAHGLACDDELTIYKSKSKEDQEHPIGTAIVVGFNDVANITKLKANPSAPFRLPCSPAPALLTKSNEIYLKLYVDMYDEHLNSRIRRLASGEYLSNVAITYNRSAAHIGLSVDMEKNQLRFDVLDRILGRKNVTLKPQFAPNDDQDLLHILQRLAHYYWHLKRTTNNPLTLDDISISFLGVKDTLSEEAPRFIPLNGSDKLCDAAGCIDIEVDDSVPDGATYGFKLANRKGDKENLFPVLLYFDNTDFTITSAFKQAAGPNPEAPWSGPSMSIGYGLGAGAAVPPFSFTMTDGYDVEAGFFKLFLSNKPIDLDTVVQDVSPFASLRGIKQKPFFPVGHRFPHQWGEKTFTVITRRKR